MQLNALRIKIWCCDDKQCPDVRAKFCVHVLKSFNGKQTTILKHVHKCVTG
jgi:hypothetical protein